MDDPQKTEGDVGPVAVVEWTIGDRRMSEFIKCAGLGIDSVGVKDRVMIKFKAGEIVDEARVLKAVHKMMADLDASNDKIMIRYPSVVKIIPEVHKA